MPEPRHSPASKLWLSDAALVTVAAMPQRFRVGGDVDAFCTRCKMDLGHTILAMVGTKPVRVRCNTCQGEHAFRGAPAAKKGSWVPASERAAKATVTSWEALLQKKDLSRARRYSAKDRYQTDDVLEHPVFGIGLVQEVRGDKIAVAFKADVKTLVHAKG
jgi:hypothetical protein